MNLRIIRALVIYFAPSALGIDLLHLNLGRCPTRHLRSKVACLMKKYRPYYEIIDILLGRTPPPLSKLLKRYAAGQSITISDRLSFVTALQTTTFPAAAV